MLWISYIDKINRLVNKIFDTKLIQINYPLYFISNTLEELRTDTIIKVRLSSVPRNYKNKLDFIHLCYVVKYID